MRMSKKQRKRKKKQQLINKKLVKKYYWLAPREFNWNGGIGNIRKDYDYSWIMWGWCNGWDKTFGQIFMEELGEAIKKSGQKNFSILQLKEKYGQLRCYTSGTTSEVHNIIQKYEVVSEHICMDCGCEAPMIEEHRWLFVCCPDCYKKLIRRRELCRSNKEGFTPKTDEEIKNIYDACVVDNPDENGEYHIPMSYKVRHYNNGEIIDEIVDISDTVTKLQKRISGYTKRREQCQNI